MDRNTQVLGIRPHIESAKVLADTKPAEAFQNETLRPIIKFQHDLIHEIVKTHISKYGVSFYKKSEQEKTSFIESLISKDLRKIFIGLIIGHFTITEYTTYIDHKTQMNKRIIQMIVKRAGGLIS